MIYIQLNAPNLSIELDIFIHTSNKHRKVETISMIPKSSLCSVVVRVMPSPKDDHILTLEVYKYASFHGKRDFAHAVKDLKRK